MITMKKEWGTLPEKVKRILGSKFDEKNDKLIELQQKLIKTITSTEIHLLVDTCDMLPVPPEKSDEFNYSVLQYMVRSFIETGDRKFLVNVLSKRYPKYVSPERPTEYYLLHCIKKKLKYPVLVLGEAYEQSKEPETRRSIASVVRSGFEGYDIPGKNDDEYVKNAMQWYEKRKDHLILRPPVHRSKQFLNTFFEEVPYPGEDNNRPRQVPK
jgi:hypothetical protein